MDEIFILIVDDKPQNLFALEQVLNGVPATIIKAQSGEEALSLTLNYEFALAILDVQMPGMDGYELASFLLDDPNTSRIPIIFLSAAYSDEQHTFKGYEQGAVDYIVKPFQPEILLRKVNVFLELARYRIQLEHLVQMRTNELQEEERKLRTIIENTPDCIFNIARDGSITFINAPKKYSHLIGTSIFELFDPACVAQETKALESVFLNQKKVDFDSLLNLPWHPEAIYYSNRLSPIIVDEKVVGCLQISRDISATKLAEFSQSEKLRAEAENKAKSRFLASMSHEIRTPMNAILGYTQLLRREEGLSPKQARYLETIDSSGEHLLSLIDSVLDMARIESGRLELAPTKINISNLIFDITRMFQLTAMKKNIQLSYLQNPSTPHWILADANKIRQVLINLVGNALKFTEKGKIELKFGVIAQKNQDLHLFIEVQDTGSGIEPEKIATIFDPFVQADSSTSRIGVGLGLSVSKEIARMMRGDLSVVSKINQGSTFRFAFTAELADKPQSKTAKHVAWAIHNEQSAEILVVDDDSANLTMLGNMLTSIGLSVTLAKSGQEALGLFAAISPGLVILDYQMNPISGIEVAQKIRELENGLNTPIIMISASPLNEYRENAAQVGANAFLAKPFREQELFAAIQSCSEIKFDVVPQALSVQTGRKEMLLHAEDLAEISPPLISNLYQAIRKGFIEEIDQAIKMIQIENEGVGDGLKALANNYQYTKLLALLGQETTPYAQ